MLHRSPLLMLTQSTYLGCHRVAFSCASRIPCLPRGGRQKVTHTHTCQPYAKIYGWRSPRASRTVTIICAAMPLPILVQPGTSTTFTANRISWVPHGQGGGSLARSLAGSWLADSKCRRRAKGKGQRHGSWRSRIRARFGNDDSVAYSRGDKERESRDFYFLSWFGLVWFCHGRSLEAWKEGKEDAMWDGGRHELLVRWRLDLSEAFLFCAGVGVGEGTVCFGIVVVMNERKVPCVMKTT